MTNNEIQNEILLGEDSQRQFKANLHNPEQVAAEIVAFLNSSGGRIFIGVSDDGSVVGLDSDNIRRLNQLMTNSATQNVRPPASIQTQNLRVEDKVIMLVDVPDGLNKPYCDNEGRFWIKNGADKRKVTSPEELQ